MTPSVLASVRAGRLLYEAYKPCQARILAQSAIIRLHMQLQLDHLQPAPARLQHCAKLADIAPPAARIYPLREQTTIDQVKRLSAQPVLPRSVPKTSVEIPSLPLEFLDCVRLVVVFVRVLTTLNPSAEVDVDSGDLERIRQPFKEACCNGKAM